MLLFVVLRSTQNLTFAVLLDNMLVRIKTKQTAKCESSKYTLISKSIFLVIYWNLKTNSYRVINTKCKETLLLLTLALTNGIELISYHCTETEYFHLKFVTSCLQIESGLFRCLFITYSKPQERIWQPGRSSRHFLIHLCASLEVLREMMPFSIYIILTFINHTHKLPRTSAFWKYSISSFLN